MFIAHRVITLTPNSLGIWHLVQPFILCQGPRSLIVLSLRCVELSEMVSSRILALGHHCIHHRLR